MNDIELLDKLIDKCKCCKFATCEQCEINWTEVKAIENLIKRVKELEEKYKRLSVEAQATAFDDDNQNTECLLRVLLKQGEIILDEKGYYQRRDFDWEENLHKIGLMKKREKNFYISDNECLDEYTKQLESQLKEYNEIKEIFKKYYVFPNDTMYDGCIKMQDEIDNYKELEKILKEKNMPIETLLGELDRLEDLEDKTDELKIRIKNIEEIEKEHQKQNGELQEKIKELELEKGLLIDGFKEERRIAIEEIREENFISKDKIEAKIDELKKNMLDTENIEVFYQRRFCYDILQELLEE